jgi:hypothetical protein
MSPCIECLLIGNEIHIGATVLLRGKFPCQNVSAENAVCLLPFAMDGGAYGVMPEKGYSDGPPVVLVGVVS